jgi:hypothetical protein
MESEARCEKPRLAGGPDVLSKSARERGRRQNVRQPNRRMPVWELWCAASVARRSERRAKAGAEGINRRQFFAPEGDLDVPSGFAKNGGAHALNLYFCNIPIQDLHCHKKGSIYILVQY